MPLRSGFLSTSSEKSDSDPSASSSATSSPRRFMRLNLVRDLEAAAVLQVRGNAGGAEGVAVDFGLDTNACGAALGYAGIRPPGAWAAG
jgi:hypothetical protein